MILEAGAGIIPPHTRHRLAMSASAVAGLRQAGRFITQHTAIRCGAERVR